MPFHNSTDTTRWGITGTGYSGSFLTGGPSGETAFLYTPTAIPLVFGTNGKIGGYIDTSQNFNVTNNLDVLGGGIVTGGTANEGAGTVDALAYYINGVPVGASSFSTVATIAALRALSVASFSTGYQALVQGYYSAGDAAGTRWYTYSSTSSGTDDNGSIIKPTVGAGRWLLTVPANTSIKPDVSWWGAYGNNSNDDTTAIYNALTWVQTVGGGTMSFGSNCNYLINPTLNTNWSSSVRQARVSRSTFSATDARSRSATPSRRTAVRTSSFSASTSAQASIRRAR